ncbi:uncharacterized protein LOC122530668 [Frieseomelitta varia]|uniref:uncharacterized protein LOC122530668 n=1 Tax=Frieseomelitta varia TaxID=561572 RepID=UPI001CB67D44|nr:uncharacterized protein LOC122530668 [Frieseomelitta varia]
MAFLYIDRIKRDFQRTDHCLSRRVTYRKWSPKIVIERLNSQTATFDNRCLSEAFPVKNTFMNLVPKVPKIFTIGLKLDRKDDDDKNARQFWNVASVKNFFKHYFSFIRRCQSYLHISWKYTPNENDFEYLSFSSSTSAISRCRRCCCHHKSHCAMPRRKHSQTFPHECEASQCSGQFSTRNSSKLESRGSQCQFTENAKGSIDPPGDICFTVDPNNKAQSVRAEAKFAKFLPESEYNSTSRVAPRNDQAVKSKKDACCQTTFTSVKSCHGSWKKNHVERKSRMENDCVSTNASSSSRVIETIFATTNFDGEKSKTNLESLGARTSRKRRIRRTDKRSRKHDAENSSRKERSGSQRELVKRERRETIKDQIHSSTETFFDCDSAANFADGDSTRIPPRRRWSDALTFVENYDIRSILNKRNGEIHAMSDHANSPGNGETPMVSRQNYLVEDKTSESMILGNVKKRLEEDYDDYFSVDNDLFVDAVDPSDVIRVDGRPSTDRYTLLNNDDDEPRSVTIHQRTKQELTKRSLRTSLTCTSSICFTDLSCSRSSYHTSMREQEHSPSTKIVDNVSPSNFHSFSDNSFNSFLHAYSMNTGLSRGNNLRTSRWENCFPNDLVNSYTVCCYQRNSTPNLSNSSKLIAESLDSGILTDDCSRDRVASNEDAIRLGEGSEEMVEQDWKRQARRNDLLLDCDLNTDSSYSDDSLNRRVDIVVKKFTDNLILSERRARTKLKGMGNSSGHGQARKRRKGQVCPVVRECVRKRSSTSKFESSPRLNDDDWAISSSTPPLFSFSESEMDHS